MIAAETIKQVGFHFLKLSTGIAVEKTLAKLHEEGALDTSFELDEDKFDEAADKVLEAASQAILADRLEGHRKAQKSVQTFRDKMSESISAITPKKLKEPFFVFVDELDRCRPLYAIRMLEEMKHLFSTKGVVFVVATDTVQLSHSVSAIYGEKFEGSRYLRRFFDRVFVFPEADRTAFVAQMLENAGIDPESTFFKTGESDPIRAIASWADAFEYSNRDLEQVLEIIVTFIASWNHKAMIEPFTLLSYVAAYYANPTQKIGNKIKEQLPQLANWAVSDFIKDYANPKRSETKGGNIYDALFGLIGTPLLDMSHSNGFVHRYYSSELQARFPSGSVNGNPRTLLREYEMRVRNAGRHLEADGIKRDIGS